MSSTGEAWHIGTMAEASVDDAEAALVFGHPWTGHRADAWLLRRWFGRSSFVAFDGAQPAGIALAMPDAEQPHALYIDQVAVSFEHRGRGLARALLDRCEAWARQQGMASLWLTVDAANPAVDCWRRLGFLAVPSGEAGGGGPLHRDYKGRGRDRILFRRAVP